MRCNAAIAARLRRVREHLYGGAIEDLAREVGVPARTWLAYERGVAIPAVVILAFLSTTGACPRWLGTGVGTPYRAGRRAGGGG
jgi:hypothetical protein